MMWLPFLALLATATPVPAPTPAPAPAPAHDPQHLSRLFAAQDYMALSRIFAGSKTAAEHGIDMDWQRDRLLNGGSALVGFWYATALWQAAEASPRQRDQLRETAVMATVYSYGAILVDGARCVDDTAVAHHRDQIVAANPALWAFARTMPIERRRLIVNVALTIDQRTAAVRAAGSDDEFVCRGGLEETTYNLAHGTQREVKTPPGGVGRTILLTGDGKYRPALVPQATAQADAARIRTTLAATLGRLIDVAL